METSKTYASILAQKRDEQDQKQKSAEMQSQSISMDIDGPLSADQLITSDKSDRLGGDRKDDEDRLFTPPQSQSNEATPVDSTTPTPEHSMNQSVSTRSSNKSYHPNDSQNGSQVSSSRDEDKSGVRSQQVDSCDGGAPYVNAADMIRSLMSDIQSMGPTETRPASSLTQSNQNASMVSGVSKSGPVKTSTLPSSMSVRNLAVGPIGKSVHSSPAGDEKTSGHGANSRTKARRHTVSNSLFTDSPFNSAFEKLSVIGSSAQSSNANLSAICDSNISSSNSDIAQSSSSLNTSQLFPAGGSAFNAFSGLRSASSRGNLASSLNQSGVDEFQNPIDWKPAAQNSHPSQRKFSLPSTFGSQSLFGGDSFNFRQQTPIEEESYPTGGRTDSIYQYPQQVEDALNSSYGLNDQKSLMFDRSLLNAPVFMPSSSSSQNVAAAHAHTGSLMNCGNGIGLSSQYGAGSGNYFDAQSSIPYGGTPQSLTCYLVQFTSGRTDTFYIAPSINVYGYEEPSNLKIKIGDYVVVEADRGEDLGRVLMDNINVPLPRKNSSGHGGQKNNQMLQHSQMQHFGLGLGMDDQYDFNYPGGGMQMFGGQQGAQSGSGNGGNNGMPKKIYRLASAVEIESLQSKIRDELNAIAVGQYKVQEWKLPMAIIDAEYQWDRRKLTYFFTVTLPTFYPNQPAPRIDFRTLVRDLYQIYRTRIWMYCVDKDNVKPTSHSGPFTNVLNGGNGASGDPGQMEDQQSRQNQRAHHREKFVRQLHKDLGISSDGADALVKQQELNFALDQHQIESLNGGNSFNVYSDLNQEKNTGGNGRNNVQVKQTRS
ncbi:hypothetical protein MIR68_010553 [Amoeboaphelidium protococcarum]|nr:hypothetical protein MIR68_010553 [Amoeboaphelidium protococcarum]